MDDKSPNPDGWQPWFLKETVQEISKLLAILCNKSLTGFFSQWKLAIVVRFLKVEHN